MRKHFTKQEALSMFKESCPVQAFTLPNGQVDVVARCEAWNAYTDMLCKDGYITEYQYNTWTNPF